MIFGQCQYYTFSCENSILLEAVFMILYDLLEEKSMVEDLNFVQLGKMPDDDSNLIKLHKLQTYIDQANKKAIPKSQIC